MYNIVSLIASLIIKCTIKLDVKGKQNLPTSGGYVIVCTHIGWVDVIALALSVLPRMVHYMAKKELFSNKLMFYFLNKLNVFPVERSNPGPSSLKIPLNLLSKGKIVGIFPTGTRTMNTSLKQGAVTIAQMANVPIIPVFYKGPSSLMLKNLIYKESAEIIIGKPIYYGSLSGEKTKVKKDRIKDYTAELEGVFRQLENETVV